MSDMNDGFSDEIGKSILRAFSLLLKLAVSAAEYNVRGS